MRLSVLLSVATVQFCGIVKANTFRQVAEDFWAFILDIEQDLPSSLKPWLESNEITIPNLMRTDWMIDNKVAINKKPFPDIIAKHLAEQAVVGARSAWDALEKLRLQLLPEVKEAEEHDIVELVDNLQVLNMDMVKHIGTEDFDDELQKWKKQVFDKYYPHVEYLDKLLQGMNQIVENANLNEEGGCDDDHSEWNDNVQKLIQQMVLVGKLWDFKNHLPNAETH